FQVISSYAAVLARLSALSEAIGRAGEAVHPIEVVDSDGALAWEGLTLTAPRDGQVLVDSLSVTVEPRSRLLVRGEDATALAALSRATAGMWESGGGRIRRPRLGDVAFLPERPYVAPGTLRQAVMNGGGPLAENPLRDVSGEIAIDEIVERA